MNSHSEKQGVVSVEGRRGFLRRSSGAILSASAVALIAGCESMAGSHSSAKSADDVGILNIALGLEHEAIGAYQISAGSGLLSKPVLDAATIFLGHHKQHRDTLASVISKMGGTPVGAKSNADYAKKLNAASLKSEQDILKLAHRLEQGAANAYISVVPKFQSGDLAHAAARISADEVMHFTVLTQVLGGALPTEALSFGA